MTGTLSPTPPGALRVSGLCAWRDDRPVLRDIDEVFPVGRITAVLGPPGCGKTALLRCIARLYELRPGARVEGEIWLGDEPLHPPSDPLRARGRVALVLSRPTLFPTWTIRENILAAWRLTRRLPPDPDAICERALSQVGLWASLRDRLDRPVGRLAAGERQRLCIARALAPEPLVLALDAPVARRDPPVAAEIEALIRDLRPGRVIVLATADAHFTGRLADDAVFLADGAVVERAPVETLLTEPQDARTEAYLTGRYV